MAAKKKPLPILTRIMDFMGLSRAIKRLGTISHRIESLELKRKEESAKVTRKYATALKKLRVQADERMLVIHVFADANQETLIESLSDRERSFHIEGVGECGWRKGNRRVALEGEKTGEASEVAVIDQLITQKNWEALRVMATLNRQYILDHPGILKGLDGISIEQAERFWVKTELMSEPMTEEVEDLEKAEKKFQFVAP